MVRNDIEFSKLLRGQLLAFNEADELCLDGILVRLSVYHNKRVIWVASLKFIKIVDHFSQVVQNGLLMSGRPHALPGNASKLTNEEINLVKHKSRQLFWDLLDVSIVLDEFIEPLLVHHRSVGIRNYSRVDL